MTNGENVSQAEEIATNVRISVKKIEKETQVSKGWFSDRLRDKINVYLEIEYEPGIPTLVSTDGKKEQIGYIYNYQGDLTGFTGEPRRGVKEKPKTPSRPVYLIEGHLYKMVLTPNDDFISAVEDLAETLVESQGQDRVEQAEWEARIQAIPNIDMSYKNKKLEERLKSI